MIAKNFKKVVLPVVIIVMIVALVTIMVMNKMQQQFRTEANYEASAWVGLLAENVPELGQAEIVQFLQDLQHHPEKMSQTKIGEDILAGYGYFPEDFVSQSSEYLWRQMIVVAMLSLSATGVATIGYFWWKDWHYSQQIRKLVVYLQELSTKAYDLRLEYNTEDELSFLSNELYKITIVLKEAAKNNHQERKNLEVALADISHQLRTPLTSLQVTLDNLSDDPEMPVEIRQDFLRSASRQVDSMSDLVTTLLNLAKLDNKTIQMKDARITAKALLGYVQEKIAVLADIADVEIVFSGELDKEVKLDAKWQTEALANIVKNCIEHSRAGGQVDINVKNSPLFTRFIITDYGDGISGNELKHIFERFYRASNAVDGSVGIGLSFAKAIIEADNGQVSVKSIEGQGTEFRVTYFKHA